MTLCVVVACKDRFYLLSDTRTLDEKAEVYTDNTQKAFFSNKHKLAICTAGAGFIINAVAPEDISKSISVSFILKDFIEYIDEFYQEDYIGIINSVNHIFILIQEFVRDRFGEEYVDSLQKHVSIFIACILNSKVSIFSYHGYDGEEKKCDEFSYEDNFKTKVCFFSNYQELFLNYSNIAVDQIEKFEPISGSNKKEKVNRLLSEISMRYRTQVLNVILPNTVSHVLGKYKQSISNHFQYVRIGKDNSMFGNNQILLLEMQNNNGTNFKWLDEKEYQPSIIVHDELDYNEKIASGELTAYNVSEETVDDQILLRR